MPKHPTKPCRTCPFRTDIPAGRTGGSGTLTYLGQIYAGMWLPCHSLYDKTREAIDQDPGQVGQCAGASIFRANIGVRKYMSPATLSLASDSRVFTSCEAFVAHHDRISMEDAAIKIREAGGLAMLGAKEVLGARRLYLGDMVGVVRRLLATSTPQHDGELEPIAKFAQDGY